MPTYLSMANLKSFSWQEKIDFLLRMVEPQLWEGFGGRTNTYRDDDVFDEMSFKERNLGLQSLVIIVNLPLYWLLRGPSIKSEKCFYLMHKEKSHKPFILLIMFLLSWNSRQARRSTSKQLHYLNRTHTASLLALQETHRNEEGALKLSHELGKHEDFTHFPSVDASRSILLASLHNSISSR